MNTMETTITFNIGKEDKEELREIALSQKLSLSSYCRYFLLKQIQENKLEAVQ